MEVVFLIGRILVGGFYLFNALNHFTQTNNLTEYARSKGVPAPKLAVLGSGLLLLMGGLSLLLGYRPDIGVAAITLFFLAVTFKMHNFWAVDDPQWRMVEMVNFLKNLALMGSAWMFLLIPTPWPFSLGG